MNRARQTFAVVCLSLFPGILVAADRGIDQPPSLSLDQAVQKALANNPSLRQAELDIGAAEARVKQARSNQLPQIDTGGLAKQGLSGSANLFGLNGLASSPEPDDTAFSANVYQDLLDFKRSKFETRARQAEVEVFNQTMLAEEALLILQVKTVFFEGLKAQERIGLARRVVEEKSLAMRKAEALQRAQLGSGLEVIRATTELARAQLGVAKATDSHRHTLARLSTTMGEPAVSVYALVQPAVQADSPEPLEGLLSEALERRAELSAVDARIRAQEDWVRRAEREKYPRIMAMFSGGWARFAELTLSRLLFGGFGIQLPLFTGGRVKATIEETRLGLQKSHAAREELVQAIGLQVIKSHRDVATALESVRTSNQDIEQARVAARLARIRYDNDLVALPELALARTALAVAEREQAAVLYDFKVAEAELEFAVGRRSN